jgi:23S rRNA pseudouridine1911/1915/1917 synthase
MPEALREIINDFPRQALHARRLSLVHPASSEPVSFEAILPEDMTNLIAALAEDAV